MSHSEGLAFQADIPGHRRELPRSLAATRVLLYLMFALTLLGGMSVLTSLLELGSRVTPVLSLLAVYAVGPGIAAVILARRVWTGGKAVWFGLIALQAWLLVGSVVNLYGGSERGFSQLLLPGALLTLVSVGASRAWFELPAEQRAVRPRWTLERLRRDAVPSIPRMIGWGRNRGQSTVEYVGMVGLVALIIGTLLLSGVGTQLAGGLQTAVCNILGGSCESDTVAGGGGDTDGDSRGGESGGGESGGGDSGDGDSDGGGSDGGGSDGGGSDGGSDGGGSDGGGSDGGSDGGGSDGGGSDGGSDGGGSDGGSDGGGSDGGSDGGGSDGGSDGGGSDGGGSDGGSDGGGSDGGGSDGGSDGGGSDGGGSDGGSDGGGSDGGGSDGGSDGGGSDGGGSDGGGSDGGGSDGGSDGGGSDGGGSDGGSDTGGSSGGVECNPVMAPWGMMQSCTETGTGGPGGGPGGGSDGGGSDGGGSDGGSSGGGSDGGGSDGGSDGGGSDGGGSDGGSDGGGSSGGVECNPVMAPWGMMQSCTETGTGGPGGGPGGGSPGGGSGGSSGGKNDDDNKDDDEDDDDQDEDDDKDDDKNDCLVGNVAFHGSVSTGAAGDGRYTLASGAGSVVVSGVALAAGPGTPSPMDVAQSVAGFSMAGVDTFQDAENRLSIALGLTDDPWLDVLDPQPAPQQDPGPEPDAEPGPEPEPDPAPGDSGPNVGGSCTERTDPMTVLDGIPDFRPGDKKDWAKEVEKIAGENPLTKNFTAEDALIVADYTGSWALDANRYLRGQQIPGRRGQQVPEFIERMDRALEHLPPVEGTFYRGTFMPEDLLKKFANGEQVEMPEYLSTSSDPAKAERAAQNAKGNGRAGENVLLEISTDNGRNIDPLSRYRGKESEVLIPRGGKFEQVGVKTKIIGGKEYKVIELKQVG